MKLDALLDVNVVAHETEDEVALLLDLEAPHREPDAQRAPSALQVVLDRSGSMHGAPLEGAKQALIALVARLEPTDAFGLVTFDHEAQVVVPCGPLTDKESVVRRIAAVDSGGSTDLGSGYLRGLRELRRAVRSAGGSGGTLLVVSDGHVNQGMCEVVQFASLAERARAARLTTSTLGYGEGYDETLLAAIARGGAGNHVFAADPDAAGAAVAAEVDGLLEKVAQGVTLTVAFEPAVKMLALLNDLPAQQIGDGRVMIELGDLYSGEQRKLLLKLHVPAMVALGLCQVATLELEHVELPGLVEQRVSIPVSVNVVPGDEAAARVPDPTVRSEVLFQEAQQVKKRASEAFERGDGRLADRYLGETERLLDAALDVAPDAIVDDIRSEQSDLRTMRLDADAAGTAYMSKRTRESFHRQNRKRGRTTGSARGIGDQP